MANSYPKIGMTYNQALKTGIRFVKEGNNKLAQSIVDQVARHEGSKGAKEFAKEIISKGVDASRKKIY